MCYKIHSDNLIANYFAVSGQKKISFQRLSSLRKSIEEAFNFAISVDVTANSIYKVVSRNSDLYELGKTYIRIYDSQKDESTLKQFVEENYNWEMPSEIKEKYLEILEHDK